MRRIYRSDWLAIVKRKIFIGLFVITGLILISFPGIAAGDENTPLARRYNIGFRILKVPRPGTESLVVAVWYPTNEKPAPMKYFLIGRELEADVAKDAFPLKGPFPLVILSHGGGVSATSLAIYAEELTASGFVVAGPDHSDEFIACRSDKKTKVRVRDWLRWAYEGSTKVARSRGQAMKYKHRPAEVTATIDYLLKLNADPKSPFYGIVAPEKIGMMGVSFGAWTTLAVSGAIPWYHDRRIKAAVPIGGHPGMSRRSTDISRLKIPVMIIFGEKETMVLLDSRSPPKTEGMKQDYALANPPKFLIGVKGAKHLNFGGAGAFNAKMGKTFSTRDVRFKDAVTGVVNKYCLAFFRRYLMDDYTAEKILTKPDPRLFIFREAFRD
ncbi:MAG: hypothetical protein GXO98_02895 [Nitrospirae bacterium]|nr:hypothetical protein [Nitrospirota bacterium]